MANIVDIHRFVAGMDLDSESRYVSPDSTRLQRNTRYDGSLQATAGATTNMLGNELMGLGAFELSGTPTIIGSCFDEKRDDVIFFVHNTNGHHTIFSYNIYTGAVIRRLISDEAYWTEDGSALDFSLTNRIHDAQVIGDVLYFRDNKRPRRLNLLKSVNIGAPNSYPYINNAVIDAIKYPPTSEPKVSLGTDTTVRGNNLKGRSFQFRYRYIYDDFGHSVCSPICAPVIPKIGYSYNGEVIFDEVYNNVISVTVETGGCSVDAIEILAREGNAGDWYIAKSINKTNSGISHNSTYTWQFYNTSVITAVDQQDINRPYDYVPKQANSQTLLDNKYLSYGGCVEGFDNIKVSCALSNVKEVLPIGILSDLYQEFIADSYDVTISGITTGVKVPFLDPGLIAALKLMAGISEIIMKIDINSFADGLSVNGDTNEYVLSPPGNISSPQVLHDAIIGYINSDFSAIAKAFSALPAGWVGPITLDNPDEILVAPFLMSDAETRRDVEIYIRFYATANGSLTRIYGGAKSGATHRFGIVYSDDSGRLSTVQTDDSLEIYIDSVSENTQGDPGVPSNNYRNKIAWEIFHDPPAWATKYHWAYAGRSGVGAYKQYLIGGPANKPAIFNVLGDEASTYIDLSLLNELTFKGTYDDATQQWVNPDISVQFPTPASLLEPYIFTKGDRIRFLTQRWSGQVIGEYPLGSRVQDYIDLEILGYAEDTDGDNTNVIRIQRISVDTAEINRGSLVEIYALRRNLESDIYYEIGETYDIVTVNGVKKHVGQDGSTATCTGYFNYVDTAHVLRSMPYALEIDDIAGQRMFWCESDNFSDFFESPVFCNGRINLYDATAKEKYSGIVRRSNPYFAETKTNGLGSFEYDKYLPLGSEYGDITKITQVGYTLKILQERKLTSVYIGKNGLRQAGADGAQVVVATDNVFNTTNPSELPYGCADPDSVVVRERQMFFFDRNSKCIVRDSANGPVDISSEWKVSSMIRPLADSIATNGGLVVAGANNKYGEILFTFAPDGEIGETVCFSQKYGNCKSMLDFYGLNAETPSAYINAGDYFYAFMNGRMWLQDVNPIRGSFFGTEHEMEITFVSNMNPQTVKVYDSIVQNANKKFTSENYTDITIAVNENQPLGMMSKLTASQYKSEEGVWIAPFLRNAVTRSATPNVFDLINGDPLRGQYMVITIRNNDTSEVILHSVIINCTHSPLTR